MNKTVGQLIHALTTAESSFLPSANAIDLIGTLTPNELIEVFPSLIDNNELAAIRLMNGVSLSSLDAASKYYVDENFKGIATIAGFKYLDVMCRISKLITEGADNE